jgi:hypothetical protein|tara:strand:+ start:135 stop:308 length:174 start_codon:yes stop_codon:yes gene_type:complete
MASDCKTQMLYDMAMRYKKEAEAETDLDKMSELYEKAIEIYDRFTKHTNERWDEGND